tara:strand:- start:2080 stop:2223 length:144 start_codon:yes stop_codon:yes gene_type:complete
MRPAGYESVSTEPAVDSATSILALVVSALSCAISIAAIGFVVFAIKN